MAAAATGHVGQHLRTSSSFTNTLKVLRCFKGERTFQTIKCTLILTSPTYIWKQYLHKPLWNILPCKPSRLVSYRQANNGGIDIYKLLDCRHPQVQQQSTMSLEGSGSSHRRQPPFPPPVSSAYSALFSSTPNLYAYPASAALASVSQAVDQLQGGSSHHARASGPYSSSLALLQKGGSLALGGAAPGQFGSHHGHQQQQHQALGGQPFHPSAAAYQRKLNPYPFL